MSTKLTSSCFDEPAESFDEPFLASDFDEVFDETFEALTSGTDVSDFVEVFDKSLEALTSSGGTSGLVVAFVASLETLSDFVEVESSGALNVAGSGRSFCRLEV